MKKTAIISIALVIVSVGIVVIIALQPQSGTPMSGQIASPTVTTNTPGTAPNSSTSTAAPSDAAIIATVSKKAPILFANGSPKFTIVKKQTPLANWSIITLRLNDTYAPDQKVVLFQSTPTSSLTIMDGPGDEILNPSLPHEVKIAIGDES